MVFICLIWGVDQIQCLINNARQELHQLINTPASGFETGFVFLLLLLPKCWDYGCMTMPVQSRVLMVRFRFILWEDKTETKSSNLETATQGQPLQQPSQNPGGKPQHCNEEPYSGGMGRLPKFKIKYAYHFSGW